MKLAIKVSRAGDLSYRAWCPALPGCMVYGQTHEEAMGKIHDAVDGYLSSLNIALPRELSRRMGEGRATA